VTLIKRLEAAFKQYHGGEARYWVNDGEATIDGTINYAGAGLPAIPFHGYVGLVDEELGGMIAYGEPKIMDELADRLNMLHIIDTVIGDGALK
jgi:hypothetical protein